MIQSRTRKIWKECDNRNSHRSSEIYLIYISSDNGQVIYIFFKSSSQPSDYCVQG
jgi:hypothetical protein